MAGLYAPLPTLRSDPRGGLRTDRGGVGCYSFIGVDSHHILLAGLPAHSLALQPAHSRGHQVVTDIRRLQTFHHLHACSGCSGWSESPGGVCIHWKSAALSRRTPLTAVGLEPSKRGREFDLVFFASCAAQPTQCQTRDSCRCLVRDREHRADVDLAQDVAVFARRGARSIEKVGVPDDRQRAGLDAQHLDLPPEKWTPGYADFASARSGVM